MLVRVSAFDVDIESATISLSSLTENLCSINGLQDGNREYYFDCESFPGFCTGVIITIKDQKNYCTLKTDEHGEHIIQVNGLEENNTIMDFNFFAINLENGIGVYQHYHQSAAISSLDRRVKVGLKDLKEQLIAKEIAEFRQANRGNISKSREAKIRARHKSKVQVRTLVSKQGLAELLSHYAKIKGMEYHYSALTPAVRHATPLGSRVQKKKESITFANPNIVNVLSREIVQAVGAFDIGKGRVFVEQADGTDDIIKIFNMPEELWERDYDEVVQLINNINVSNFKENQFLHTLISLFDDNRYTNILRADIQ